MNMLKRLLFSRTTYGIGMVFLLWSGVHLVLQSRVIPGPYVTMVEFIDLFPKGLWLHSLMSLMRISIAITISICIGVPLGLWIGVNQRVDTLFSPVVYILFPIPKIAFLPVFMILFGLGDLSKISLMISIILFQILIVTRDGVVQIPNELYYSVATLGLSKFGIYRHLIVPAVLPKIFSGLRISLGISISTLFFAENFATTYGIGYFIMNAWTMVDYPEMFAGILALSLMGLILFKLLDLAEVKLCPWLYVK